MILIPEQFISGGSFVYTIGIVIAAIFAIVLVGFFCGCVMLFIMCCTTEIENCCIRRGWMRSPEIDYHTYLSDDV